MAKYNTNLKVLSLSECKFLTDAIVEDAFPKLKVLEKIGLGQCALLGDLAVKTICETSKERLNTLGLNYLTGLTDLSLHHIKGNCPNIRILSLSGIPSLTSQAFQDLTATCHCLGSIDLSGCLLMDDATLFAIAKNCLTLFQLNVSHDPNISDDGVVAVAKACLHLRLIFLSACKITNYSVEMLAASPACKLEVLVLAKCEAITEDIVQYLRKTPPLPLRILDISKTGIQSNEQTVNELLKLAGTVAFS